MKDGPGRDRLFRRRQAARHSRAGPQAKGKPVAFAAQFLKKPAELGTFFRSSPVLARRVANEAMHFAPKTVVEVGCGDGAITKVLLKAAHKHDAQLLACDINPDLLAHNGTRGILFRGDAFRLPVRRADVVVSGLPMALFSREKTAEILRGFREIAPHYVQFQYSTARLRTIRTVYPNARVATYVLTNLPPAVVIVA